jgi:hypothetical protein
VFEYVDGMPSGRLERMLSILLRSVNEVNAEPVMGIDGDGGADVGGAGTSQGEILSRFGDPGVDALCTCS